MAKRKKKFLKVMPFGEHKGKKFSHIPRSYLEWAAKTIGGVVGRSAKRALRTYKSITVRGREYFPTDSRECPFDPDEGGKPVEAVTRPKSLPDDPADVTDYALERAVAAKLNMPVRWYSTHWQPAMRAVNVISKYCHVHLALSTTPLGDTSWLVVLTTKGPEPKQFSYQDECGPVALCKAILQLPDDLVQENQNVQEKEEQEGQDARADEGD